MVKYYCTLGRIWKRQGIRKQVCFVSKALRIWGGGSSGDPGKPCSFYPYLSLGTVFSALKVPQNWFIMNIGSPTHRIYLAYKIIFTIWQNVKARELQKSQIPTCLKIENYLEVQSKTNILKSQKWNCEPIGNLVDVIEILILGKALLILFFRCL